MEVVGTMFAPPIGKPKQVKAVNQRVAISLSPDRSERLISPSSPLGSFDLSRIPVSTSGHPGIRRTSFPFSDLPIQAKARGTNRAALSPAVGSAIERKRGAGQPLGVELRRRVEQSVGWDLSDVRVHTDPEAARLSDAIDASAFTTGRDVFFGQGAYSPDSFGGMQLLAHELTHVAQQRGGSVPSNVALGDPADRFEREADSIAEIVSRKTVAQAGSVLAVSSVPLQPIQRAPRKGKQPNQTKTAATKTVATTNPKTWAGEFHAERYNVGSDAPDHYGADIEIWFTPNNSVDAEMIGIVQRATGYQSGNGGHLDPLDDVPQPGTVNTVADQDAFKNRLIDDSYSPDFGGHIDAPPDSRTPLVYMASPPKGDNSISHSSPSKDFNLNPSDPRDEKHTQFGWRSSTKGTRKAMFGDIPRMNAGKEEAASQEFETTALAVEGAQEGTYYGSVKWGWIKKANETTAKEIPFQLAKDASPTPSFFKAAKQWNASKDSLGETSLRLPITGDKIVKSKTDLLADPGQATTLVGELSAKTSVQTMDVPTQRGLVKVIVTSGPLTGQVGWMEAKQVVEKTPAIPPKKSK